MATWETDMRAYMNETFLLEFTFPHTLATEVFTDTEPVARAIRRRGLHAGDSLTLSSGWDLRLQKDQIAAFEVLKRTKPYVVVLAFPCGPWSSLQFLNPAANLAGMREEALSLIAFALRVAEFQVAHGRHYVMENPRNSMAWRLPTLQDFVLRTHSLEVVLDMCCFNLRAPDGLLHKKPTKLLTSMQAVVSAFLNCSCEGDHNHAPVMGGSKITAAAGHYTSEFSDALVEAFLEQYDFEKVVLFSPDSSPEGGTEVFLTENEAFAADRDDDMESEGSDEEELVKDDAKVLISPAIKNAVYRLHVNTGHRSNQRLARALLVAGAPHDAVLAAKRLKCSVCRERQPPKPRLPASLPPPREVGQQVHVDLLQIEDSLKRPHWIAHATDNVSRFQAARVLEDKSSSACIEFLTVHWIGLMGFPHTLVADQGREFISAEFCDWCDSKSIYLYHCGVGAPWQNGIAERSGATLRALTSAICQTHAVSTYEEMQCAVSEGVAAYNNDVNESGVSPQQMVTGKNTRSQGDVLAEFGNHLAEHSLLECPVEHVRKASSLESIASGSWEAAIEEVISAAQNDAVNREDEQDVEPLPEDERPLPVVATSSPLTPAEVVAAISPPAQAPSRDAPSAVGSGIATPLPEGVAQAVQRTPFPQATAKALARTLERAREFDEGERGTKRPAEDDLPREDAFARPSTSGELRPSEATAFEALVLDRENPPTIGTITRVNSLIREFKRTGDFELVFRPVDYRTAGIVAISDAALGNVQRSGAGIGSPLEKVYSQAGYVILLGDKDLVRGQHGRFNIIDCRSHRISRVCRSTYSAETLSAEESIDVGQLCRGFLASLWGKNVIGKAADRAMDSVWFTAVVDAKDVHDKGNSDTPSFGSQKSLAFTIGWLRAILRRPHTALKWTATSNMWIDALTKDMDLTHVRRIMSAGEWSVSYSPEFVRQVSKTKKAKPSDDPASAELPGERLNGDDPLLPHLARLADRKGLVQLICPSGALLADFV
ncbi:unnamed protein product [Durusdinium trenchii]|uniref:Integrase catalytic domain-containing protein n=1 Tax=Durusdinium trenchii TaxID=1381693 RepID=A0ABP0SA37_9DINO